MRRLIVTLGLVYIVFASGYAVAGEAEDMMATFLNLKGQLCAKVVNVSKLSLPNTYEVRCIEYRGGTGTVDYIVNVKTGEAVKR